MNDCPHSVYLQTIIFMKRLILCLIIITSLPLSAFAQWGEEWIYCPLSIQVSYQYSFQPKGAGEIYPIGFEAKVTRASNGWIGVSTGGVAGGNWKNKVLSYDEISKSDSKMYHYNLISNYYVMPSIGLETGPLSLQIALGVVGVQFSKVGQAEMRDFIYYIPVDYHNTVYFIMEPSVSLNIPIYAGFKLPIKVGYQIIPSAKKLNNWVIGAGILFPLEFD